MFVGKHFANNDGCLSIGNGVPLVSCQVTVCSLGYRDWLPGKIRLGVRSDLVGEGTNQWHTIRSRPHDNVIN